MFARLGLCGFFKTAGFALWVLSKARESLRFLQLVRSHRVFFKSIRCLLGAARDLLFFLCQLILAAELVEMEHFLMHSENVS